MEGKITPKRKKFVKAYVETGVSAEAARQAFDIDPKNNQLAASIGSEYLSKPEIQKAIAEEYALYPVLRHSLTLVYSYCC